MGRSVVTNESPRCERCLLPPRWCLCEVQHEVACPLAIDVLMHAKEAVKPTSTGHLIRRLLTGSRQHIFGGQDIPLDRDSIIRPGKELWVLHPRGEPMPQVDDPSGIQVLLLDGSWKQSVRMMQSVDGWGRKISLPMQGESRFWLRTQHEEGNFSTMEALLFVLQALGLHVQEHDLRLQFELHVYAGLRLRGNKALAEEFLSNSPIRGELGEFLELLCAKRPNPRSI